MCIYIYKKYKTLHENFLRLYKEKEKIIRRIKFNCNFLKIKIYFFGLMYIKFDSNFVFVRE